MKKKRTMDRYLVLKLNNSWRLDKDLRINAIFNFFSHFNVWKIRAKLTKRVIDESRNEKQKTSTPQFHAIKPPARERCTVWCK